MEAACITELLTRPLSINPLHLTAHPVVCFSSEKRSSKKLLHRLQSCLSLSESRTHHACMIKSGLLMESSVGNQLISMYGKLNSLRDATLVFNRMSQDDVVSWTAIIDAHNRAADFLSAIDAYIKMLEMGIQPNRVTFITVLGSCAAAKYLDEGYGIHTRVVMDASDGDLMIGTALMNMYVKCGAMETARDVFMDMPQLNVVTLNVLIAGYTEAGCNEEAIKVYADMELQGLKPTRATFLAILSCCGNLAKLSMGKETHSHIVEDGLDGDSLIETALVSMYGKCRALDEAEFVFARTKKHSVVSYTAMVVACTEQGLHERALEAYKQMQAEGLDADEVTFASVLSACAELETLVEGQEIHGQIVRKGYEPSIAIKNALMAMYGKCEALEEACALFTSMEDHTTISWNTMMDIYVKHGYDDEAVMLYREMVEKGVQPNIVTYTIVCTASWCVAGLSFGQDLHKLVIEAGYEADAMMGIALVGMYGKCGALEDAHATFDEMPVQDVVAWTCIIAAYAQQGNGKVLFKLFEDMQQHGVNPNGVTLVAVLSVCSHMGLIDEGYTHFMSMTQSHGILPMVEHSVCMIDLLVRAGCLDEVERAFYELSLNASGYAWSALLGGHEIH